MLCLTKWIGLKDGSVLGYVSESPEHASFFFLLTSKMLLSYEAGKYNTIHLLNAVKTLFLLLLLL